MFNSTEISMAGTGSCAMMKVKQRCRAQIWNHGHAGHVEASDIMPKLISNPRARRISPTEQPGDFSDNLYARNRFSHFMMSICLCNLLQGDRRRWIGYETM